jgi:hypothetical protein
MPDGWWEREERDKDELDVQVGRRREIYRHELYAKVRPVCRSDRLML